MIRPGPIRSEWRNALRAGAFMLLHTLLAALLIGLVAIGQWWLTWLGEPRLFRRVPVSYIFDAMDAAILLVFGFMGVSHAITAFKGEVDEPGGDGEDSQRNGGSD